MSGDRVGPPAPRLRRASTVGVVLCAASVAVVSYAQQANPTASRSVWDRVFTDAQATRGEELYGRHCVDCHGSGLDGAVSEIPAPAGDPFLQRWSTRSVDDLLA